MALKWEKRDYPKGAYGIFPSTPVRGLLPPPKPKESEPLPEIRMIYCEDVPVNEVWVTDGKTATKFKLWDWEGIE